ncbi:hypothetical protein LS1_00625 [Ligilactobacillus salivarius]|nr:hypothetical protein LS1_00625 [Ligilactobacillus salivarius]
MKKSGSIITIIIIVILAGVIVGVFGMPYIQQRKSSSSSSNVKVEKKESFKESSSSSSREERSSSSTLDSIESSSSTVARRDSEIVIPSFNQKRDQQDVDLANMTVPQCLLWALSERYSYQNADEQSWEELKDSIDSAKLIPATKSSDKYVHIYFKYGSQDCNYYIDGDYDLCDEEGYVISRYPTEFENEKANNYVMSRYQ